jgi:high-affinity iron transporter
MLSTAIIVFREVLEAALIVSIGCAATRGIAGRNRWVIAGLILGLVGSALVAVGAERISRLASGLGQEIFNASILGMAVVMLAWHNIWMASHGKEMAGTLYGVGNAVRSGASALSALMIVIGLAVLREGSETVLFLHGVAASNGGEGNQMLLGGFFGAMAGVVVGLTVYRGLLGIPLRWFFAVTSTMVLLLASGMAADAVRFLIQADILPALVDPLWDTSRLLTDDSITGKLLHGLIGYTSRPTGMQVASYLVVLVLIFSGMKWADRANNHRAMVKK